MQMGKNKGYGTVCNLKKGRRGDYTGTEVRRSCGS